MSHHEEITLKVTPEHGNAVNAAIVCYLLWLDQHPEHKQLRADIPLLEEVLAQLKPQTVQSHMFGNWTATNEITS
jgi:hypothetical protein